MIDRVILLTFCTFDISRVQNISSIQYMSYIRFVDDKMNQFMCLNFTVNITCSQFYGVSLLNSSFFFFCRFLINNVVKRFCGGVRPPGLTCIHARVMHRFCSISDNIITVRVVYHKFKPL